MELKETIINEDVVYRCPIFKVTAGTVELPDGKMASRNRVLHTGGCGVLPITAEGKIVLVEQYRYGIGEITLEIPAGKLEAGEDPKSCALRELREEVGAMTDDLIDLGVLAATPAYDSELIYIYMAHCNEFVAQKLDDDEFLHLRSVDLNEAVKMVMNGQIIDSKTQIAVLKAKELLVK